MESVVVSGIGVVLEIEVKKWTSPNRFMSVRIGIVQPLTLFQSWLYVLACTAKVCPGLPF
jgi:hypothetical protein